MFLKNITTQIDLVLYVERISKLLNGLSSVKKIIKIIFGYRFLDFILTFCLDLRTLLILPYIQKWCSFPFRLKNVLGKVRYSVPGKRLPLPFSTYRRTNYVLL